RSWNHLCDVQKRHKRDHGGNADGDNEKTKADARAPALPDEWLLGVFPGFLIDPACFVVHMALRFKPADFAVARRDGAVLAEARLVGWMCVPEAGAPRVWFRVRGPGDVPASSGAACFSA